MILKDFQQINDRVHHGKYLEHRTERKVSGRK